MTKGEIIREIAEQGEVEAVVQRIAHARELDDDLKDLVQTVYLILLEFDEPKIVELWEKGWMDNFIARIVCNQYRSTSSPYYKAVKRFAAMCERITGRMENKTPA